MIARTLDARALVGVLPMGTHWLWHCLGAGAVQLLILCIWRSNLRKAAPPLPAGEVRVTA